MKVRLTKDGENLEGVVKKGSVLAGEQIFRLVETGCAEPADKECYDLVKRRGLTRHLGDEKDYVFVSDEPAEDEKKEATHASGQASASGDHPAADHDTDGVRRRRDTVANVGPRVRGSEASDARN
jgi:hypothetical protein